MLCELFQHNHIKYTPTLFSVEHELFYMCLSIYCTGQEVHQRKCRESITTTVYDRLLSGLKNNTKSKGASGGNYIQFININIAIQKRDHYRQIKCWFYQH